MTLTNQHRPRIAVIGCGTQMTTNLFPALQLQEVEIVAACDISEEALQRFARAFRIERTYNTFERLLEEESIQGVCIAVGPREHPVLITSALRKGLRVFVEKPPAMSADEAASIQELCQQASTHVMVGFNKRFAPAYRSVMQIGKRAGEGRPVAVSIRATCGPYDTDEYLLRDFAIHYVDLLRYFLGEVRRVYALHYPVRAGASVYCLNVETTPGGIGQLFLTSLDSWANPSERVIVQWKHQAVEVNNLTELVHRRKSIDLRGGWNDEFDSTVNQYWQPNFSLPSIANNSLFLNGYLGEIAQFTHTVALGFPANPSLKDAVADLNVLESIALSLDSGEPVPVAAKKERSPS